MTDIATYKKLLKQCVELIDDWDLVHGTQSPADLKELIGLLVVSAHAADMDPNKLSSLQDMLQDGKYELRVRKVDEE